MIRELRSNGKVVIQQLPDQLLNKATTVYTATIEKNDQGWFIKKMET